MNTDNIKISFYGNPYFEIDEENRVTYCELTGYITFPDSLKNLKVPFDRKITVSATAVCDMFDRYEVARGKRIALAKAENKMYRKVYSMINKYADYLDNILSVVDNFNDKAFKVVGHNDDYIDTLCDFSNKNYRKDVKDFKDE